MKLEVFGETFRNITIFVPGTRGYASVRAGTRGSKILKNSEETLNLHET